MLGQDGPSEAEGVWDLPLSQVPKGPHSLHLRPKGLEKLQSDHAYAVHVWLREGHRDIQRLDSVQYGYEDVSDEIQWWWDSWLHQAAWLKITEFNTVQLPINHYSCVYLWIIVRGLQLLWSSVHKRPNACGMWGAWKMHQMCDSNAHSTIYWWFKKCSCARNKKTSRYYHRSLT